MLFAVSGGIKIEDQTEWFCLAICLLRTFKIMLLWTFDSRSLTSKYIICWRKAVKVKARVLSAKQAMFIGEECKKRERCYFPVSSNSRDRHCLRGVKIFFGLEDSGKKENLTSDNLTVLSSWWLLVLCIWILYCYGLHWEFLLMNFPGKEKRIW